ncbi:hypothetical protein jhhlp_007683 [Lomentospora prolificans]|uniref:5-oxoprolinase n=1 Tax=Lomentospora prolificans TaxID=41688 RepID=A0A2N3N096_9PEZI|nr:hypothetical protein jhhlp_007683 [Lomentospora prolificans]
MGNPETTAPDRGIRIAIDRGGTFTDCVGEKDGETIILKLLSEDPSNYRDAPLEGIRRIMSHFLQRDITRDEKLDTSQIMSIRMGTTVATNALLERKGERMALVVTKGFRDCLLIGNQSRPKIFDLAIKKPKVLYSAVVEVDERVTPEDYAEDPMRNQTAAHAKVGTREALKKDLIEGLSGETIRVLKRPREEDVRLQLQEVYDAGIRSIAVCLLHGYTFPTHEATVGRIAAEIGFSHISLSHELMPMVKLVSRATSVCADAYLTPTIKRYIAGFQGGFTGSLGIAGGLDENGARCEFMQSDGGLVDVDRFTGLKAILSGPAGGVVGYAITSYDDKSKTPIIGFDMGGMVSDPNFGALRYGDGRYDHVFETTTAGVTIQSPQLDINTVAAGGGSMLFWKNGLFVIGPESAGAHPGPACYRKGGPATVTDANLYLGRLLPEFFPKIFGEHEDEGLDFEASARVLQELADQVNRESSKEMSVDEVAFGFLTVANEAMTRPIRSITEAKGHDSSKHRLATFGGAGGQHAVAIAEALGIRQILVHRYSSVLSAYGMALADVVEERQEPESTVWRDDDSAIGCLKEKMERLRAACLESLKEQGFQHHEISFEEYLNMRYRGTESALMIVKPNKEEAGRKYGGMDWAFGNAFIDKHRYEFGFTLNDRDIIVDDVRIRATGRNSRVREDTVDEQLGKVTRGPADGSKVHGQQRVYFEGGRWDTPIYRLSDLSIGDEVRGPAILADGTQTIVLPPRAQALVIETHIVIDVEQDDSKDEGTSGLEVVDPILLSIFGHRFMAIAEQMGHTLQKTSVSTNVKERLDFSCAIFDADGGLVANAPHLPVHLGSMSTCVKRQAAIWRGKLKAGDVIITNHPSYGGTHLPDVTLIMPAFNNNGDQIVFYAASRAHHADIGGISAGSMPPQSRELYQEGAAVKSEKLVSEGRFDEEKIIELFYREPAKYPGCSGTRCLADNINDLRAQVSANKKGISLIESLIDEYGEETVQFYMRNIQKNAESCVRKLLKDIHSRFSGKDLSAVDYMDDGSPIQLRVAIDPEHGEAIFDFEGTGLEVYGNINAPEAVTYSAIIYCLRCLISDDIPLNQGCLAPIKVKIPQGSLLSPTDGAAVVGGNVLTSQRVTDVIFKAFEACAASQGDCNNLTFGFGGNTAGEEEVKGFGYYETIAGGSGAGPDWEGTSGVHTHMTNTRITDSEIFEKRYPVILKIFSLREGSGGLGQHRGGDGVVRDIEFRIPVQVSILSERRVFRPYGLAGGADGHPGLNLWIRRQRKATLDGATSPVEMEHEEQAYNLGSKNTALMKAGDRIVIYTPGGGGWGDANLAKATRRSIDPLTGWKMAGHANRENLALQA